MTGMQAVLIARKYLCERDTSLPLLRYSLLLREQNLIERYLQMDETTATPIEARCVLNEIALLHCLLEATTIKAKHPKGD